MKRTDVLRALVRTGLRLTGTDSFVIEYLEEGTGRNIRFKLSLEEFAQVTDLQSGYVKGLSNAAEPPRASVQITLIKLGLSEAERKDGFPDFMTEVKSSLWPRRPSQRSDRRATEERLKERHTTAPSDAAHLDPSSPTINTIAHVAPLHEFDKSTTTSNDVENGEQRVFATVGRQLIVKALCGSPSQPAGAVPPPEEQARLRALAGAALGAALDADSARDEGSGEAAPMTEPPPGWQERVLAAIEESEARGPTSPERPSRPPG